jgi:hypothetical protein
MAQVKVTNTREHAIHLNVNKQTFLIPGKREDPEDRSKTINGHLLIDEEHVEAAKKHKVAGMYFKEGWLRVPKSGAPADDKK